MKTLLSALLMIAISGCSGKAGLPSAQPYDNPREGYVVYTPNAEYQLSDGRYLKGFSASGIQYLSNCTGSESFKANKQLPSVLRYNEQDGVVYLKYALGPSLASCDINYGVIKADVESYAARRKLAESAALKENKAHQSTEISEGNPSEKSEVRFGGYVATKNDLLGSILLACYTGSLDTDDRITSSEEQASRYKALVGLYEGDNLAIKRVSRSFEFARRNLSDRYPLDARGQYRASVCDQMVMKGKL